MAAPGFKQSLDDAIERLVAAAVRLSRALDEPRRAFLAVALEPLVASLATDAVRGAELDHRERAALYIGNETGALIHG